MGDDRRFQEAVGLSKRVDPLPTLRALAESTGVAFEDVVHHALVRYAADGAEALLAVGPHSLRELVAARREQDWEKVAALIDYLAAGFESDRWRH
jgi:hypothetical protein